MDQPERPERPELPAPPVEERPAAAPAARPAAARARSPKASPPVPEGQRSQGWWAGAVVAVSLFGPLAVPGVWDPFELRVAELSRRIAHTLLGGAALAVEGANNAVPTVGELARGQLPFTSVALGFRLFGLSEWAGRLPLALWGAAGIGAVAWMVRRLADARAASMAAVALATMPLWFLQSRTLLGDVVTLAAAAMAVSGFAVALLDRDEDGHAAPAAVGAGVALGALGLAAGYGARGLILGVAAPALAVALGWLVVRTAGLVPGSRGRDALAGALALAGAAAAGLGARAIVENLATVPREYSPWVGAVLSPPRQLPTFDAIVLQLGHGLFPWSALIPVLVGRMAAAPHGLVGVVAEREAALRLVAVVVAAVTFAAQGFLAPLTGVLPYTGVAALGVIAALGLRDLDRGGPRSGAMVLAALAVLVVLLQDFRVMPDKGLTAFVVEGATVPESFGKTAKLLLAVTAAACASGVLAALPAEVFTLPPATGRWARLLARLPRPLRAALQGSGEGEHGAGGEASPSGTGRSVGWPVLTGTAAGGLVLSLGYYPLLAVQLSPKEVFDAYRELASGRQQALGTLGVGSGAAMYYAGRDVPSFAGAPQAFDWLMKEPAERRWLAVRAKDLPHLNSLYRGKTTPPVNLPVLDARSSEILLVSNQLAQGEQNKNPFEPWFLATVPSVGRPVSFILGDQLEVVGWDITDPEGKSVPDIRPRARYQFHIVYKVLAAISGNWETFIHIDGHGRRFNGDHKTLDEKYPFHLWKVGDVVRDIFPFELEPNFTAGEYEVLFGLFIGNRRLEVKRGDHHENRVKAGKIVVR